MIRDRLRIDALPWLMMAAIALAPIGCGGGCGGSGEVSSGKLQPAFRNLGKRGESELPRRAS
ncbi:MAG TPA: hypothetical protein VEB21_20775 [Terriglobales bacterium]|nr:hypothetical protein [Terriglobales bacterium]